MTNPKPPADQGDAIQKLLDLWKRRSQQAFPVDAMTINKCIRELEECIASEPVTLQAKLDEANLLALSLQGQIVTMMAQPTEAWLIEFTCPAEKTKNKRVFATNAIADYRQIDPNATVTELIPRVSPSMTNDDAECAMLYRWLRDQKSLSLTTDGSLWTNKTGVFTSSHRLCANGTQFAPARTLDENIKAAMAVQVSPL